MHSDITRLLQDLTSNDAEIRDKAVGYIGLLLEKNSSINQDESAYRDLIPENLLMIALSKEEQKLLINALCQAISSENMTAGMVWALGKADADLALEPLLQVIQNQKQKFNEETNWQSLIALDNFLVHSRKHDALQQQHGLVDSYDIKPWVAQFIGSSELRLQKMANWLYSIL